MKYWFRSRSIEETMTSKDITIRYFLYIFL